MSENQNYTKEQLEAEQLAGECLEEANKLLNAGELKNALEMAERARDLFKSISDKYHEALSLNMISIIYDEMGNETMDLEYLLDAIEIADEEKNYELSARFYNNIGSKYMVVKAYDCALHAFEKAVEMYEAAKKVGLRNEDHAHAFVLVLNLNLATIYGIIGAYEKAKQHVDIAAKEMEFAGNADMQLTFQSIEGLTYWRVGDQDKARELVETIMQTARETEYTTDYLEVMSTIIQLLKEMRDFERWEQILNQMNERLTDDVSLYVQLEILKQWIDFYKESGDVEKYHDACIKYYELSVKKDAKDYKQRADAISMKIKMRFDEKAKAKTAIKVYRDALTGIGNRNKMLEDSKTVIEESIKTDNAITVGLIDIDFFKECNDTYGHIKGDECLKSVAKIIKESVGTNGKVYRYGGDEFLVLMKQLTPEQIGEIGKRIKGRLDIEKIPNENSKVVPYVTVSQGYTEAIAEEGDTIDHLVDLADKVLYYVKENGRNDYKFMEIDEV